MLVRQQIALERALDEVSALLLLNVQDRPEFVEQAMPWFATAAKQTGQLPAHVRSAIAREAAFAAASARGYRDASLPANLHGRRAQAATMALCLARVEMALQEHLKTVRQRVTDAREKIVQLLAVTSKAHALELTQGKDPSLLAIELWRAVSSNGPETTAMVNYLRFAISATDRLLLMRDILLQAMDAAAQASTAPAS
jgi:hypothetical protein